MSVGRIYRGKRPLHRTPSRGPYLKTLSNPCLLERPTFYPAFQRRFRSIGRHFWRSVLWLEDDVVHFNPISRSCSFHLKPGAFRPLPPYQFLARPPSIALGTGRSAMVKSPARASTTAGIMFTAIAMVPVPPGISGRMAMLMGGSPSMLM